MKPLLSGQERRELYIRLCLRIIPAVFICWIVAEHFGALLLFVVLFVVPYILASKLNHAVDFLSEKLSVSRRILSFICVSIMIVTLAVLLYAAAGQIADECMQLINSWDDMQDTLIDTVNRISGIVSSLAGKGDAEIQTKLISLIQSGLQWLNEWIAAWTPPVIEQAGSILETLMSVFLSCILFFAACFYFTAEYPGLKENIRLHAPAVLRGRGSRVRQAVRIAAGGYLKAQLMLSFFVMLFLLLGFLLIGQRYKVILSILIAVIDFIPIFGSGTVLVPWGIIALLSGNFSKAIFLLVMAAFLFVFRKVAEPKIMSNQTGLSTLVSLMCIYVGMKLDGIFGMIIAPVACLVVRNLYQAGMFDSTIADFRTLWLDLRSLLNTAQEV